MRVPQFSGYIFTRRDLDTHNPNLYDQLASRAADHDDYTSFVTGWHYPDPTAQAAAQSALTQAKEPFCSIPQEAPEGARSSPRMIARNWAIDAHDFIRTQEEQM